MFTCWLVCVYRYSYPLLHLCFATVYLKPAVALLPESLDDIAPARELSASQVRLVDQAQQIIDLLPGPVIETGEFLHRGSEGLRYTGRKTVHTIMIWPTIHDRLMLVWRRGRYGWPRGSFKPTDEGQRGERHDFP